MEITKLSNGVDIPTIGIGTFMISPEDTETSVYEAIKGGYRMVDTANAYANEKAVGKAIRRAMDEKIIRREEIFVSTKIWASLYEDVSAVEKTLERLGLDYVDLLFIHQPSGDFMTGYKMIEKAYNQGQTKSIGISNMHGEKLERLLAEAEITPQVIQLEAHPYCTEKEIMDRLEEFGTKLMSWYPLGHGDPEIFQEEILQRLADKYRKSIAQIILRWHIQKGFIAIPGSKNKDHIRANFDIFDFTLTSEEMSEIAKLDGKKKYYEPNNDIEESYATMNLPVE